MKFTTALLSALLAAESIVAAPHTAKRAARREARRLSRRTGASLRSQPKIASTLESNTSFVEYSSNWAGAVLSSSGYTSVTGVATVPSVSGSSGAGGAAWVGIDGDTCDTAILQTGFDWEVDGSYSAWYEWYPDYSYDFDIEISEGDSIKMTVTATSKTSGTATIENETTGSSVTETFTGVTDGSLCEYDAEWIVEDYEECYSSDDCELVPFADFGTVTFTDCSAVKSGETVTVSGATILDIEQSGSVLTSCSDTSSTVTCTYE